MVCFRCVVANCVRELKEEMKRQGWSHKASLTHREMVFVAIAYNRGRANLSKGFKQGHGDGQGVYYGQYIDRFLKAAKSAPVSTKVVDSPPPRNQIMPEALPTDSKEVVNFDKVPRYIKNEIDQPDKSIKTGEKGKRVKRVRAVAEQHVVQHPLEIGGNNRGPWVRLYCEGNDGRDWAWCAGFVSLIMQQAFFYRDEEPPIKGSVSCDVLAAQAKSAGIFVAGKDIVSGLAMTLILMHW